MTDDTTYREKGRAVFLAALMVLSVVAMSAAFAGSAAANHTEETTVTASANDGDRAYQGQTVTATGVSPLNEEDRTVDLYQGDSDDATWIREVDVSGDSGTGDVEIDTSNFESGSYYLETGGSDDLTFDVRIQDLSAEFDSSVVTNLEGESSETTLDVESARSSFPVHISSEDLSGDELVDVFGVTEGSDYDHSDDGYVVVQDRGSHDADFQSLEAGEYNFTIEAGDTAAETSASITVTEEDISVDFTQSTFVEQRSNVADVTVDFTNADNAYLVIGDESEVNYEVVLKVTPENNDDEVTVSVNSASANKVAESDEGNTHSAFTADNNANVVVEDVVKGGLDDPLAAGDYQLDLGGTYSEADGLSQEYDTAYLTLEERTELSEDAVATHTAPQGDIASVSDFEDATVTESDQIAAGDQLLVTVDMESLHGYFDDGTSHDSVSLTVTEQDSSPNSEPQVWSTDAGEGENDLTADLISANQSEGQLIYAITASDLYDGSAADFEDSQNFNANFSVSTDNPYVSDSDESAESEFSIEERIIEWDDSAAEVPTSADAVVTGTTTVAPGTEITTRARAAGTFVKFEDAVVDEDRAFGAEYNFSAEAAGTEFTLRATDPVTSEHTTMDSVLVEADEPEEPAPFNYDVTTDPAEPKAGDDVSATITVENPNDMTGSENVTFVFDGETLVDETVSLEASSSTTLEADLLENASAGDYEWTLTADGEEVDSGTLTVDEAEKKGESDGSTDGTDGSTDGTDGSTDGTDGSTDGTDGSTDGTDGSTDDGNTSDDGGSDDGTPGFGVGVALVALLGAAMLALRRQN
ncbi:BGTF surface domain-containing protein [Natrinema sp. HArc-T2]|uniref:BGTF surface domain-containing protein n=1 Tax=Natrinema sp. HArc-T2 TaxID=3242701 RepID=UPI00359D8BE2